MDNVNEMNNIGSAEAAEAENRSIAAPDLGKFKDVDALLSAYRNLEAEFTRRSQRLKEIEEGSKAQSVPDEGAPSRIAGGEELLKAALSDEVVKNAVVAEYLGTIARGGSVSLISGGEAVSAPNAKPKSVREAGALAARFLKN